ncbi:GyrI-like domain-containing protein [Alteribacter keqinensis]|uniref:GyrI-like domain-containing protein n=1 Tax=Alteribacter keqinensis TaxID=2483800 RepID=UPI001606EC5F|nr:effector binding domain-containing protein [Alteribacter keqinensis]
MVDVTQIGEDGYWVGLEVEEFNRIPEGMTSLSVPPGKYAVKEYEGSASQIMKVYNELHNEMSSAGVRRDLQAWHLEEYPGWLGYRAGV